MSYRAPTGSAMRSAAPATRQAAGAPSAWSQPSQSTHARPRRWCDAGSPGRQCVPEAQKAGAEDTSGAATGAATGTGAVSVSVGDRTNPHRYTTIAGGTPALQASQRPLQRPRLVGDGTNPHRYTTIAGGSRRYKHRSALCSAHVSWAMEPTRIGTPPSPAGRRRYKHRSALCSAHVSWAMEPTRIGTPPSPAGRRRYKHRSALCSAHVSRAMEPTRIGTPPSPAGRRRYKHRSALCSARVSRTMVRPRRPVTPVAKKPALPVGNAGF